MHLSALLCLPKRDTVGAAGEPSSGGSASSPGGDRQGYTVHLCYVMSNDLSGVLCLAASHAYMNFTVHPAVCPHKSVKAICRQLMTLLHGCATLKCFNRRMLSARFSLRSHITELSRPLLLDIKLRSVYMVSKMAELIMLAWQIHI